jgi:hypothetical protein
LHCSMFYCVPKFVPCNWFEFVVDHVHV